ncbi:TrkA family protein [Gelidibacter algens]|jgi:di/tricarboxylate transporter|uniref:TrkA family protein n=1 Tax=Gelidibacter algens TaxID=49280 RepID=A0A1A7R7C6_9FLAO|nr:SLC13 family permease [Gelidibacter algens]OBX26647.1 potassium transporter TrkA [Gelidibacter algens]RAJ25704.1 TrkA family protein [Gelidibacter algens]
MSFEIILVFVILGVTILLFATEALPIDKIAFLIIVALVLSGLTTPEEAISGFSSPATITILMLMILSIGLEENGVIDLLTQSIKRLKILPMVLLVPAFMLISASISAFISTTAVVVIFIKIIAQLSEKYNFSAPKLLMPISFAGILGGSCTLMGTSTNLLVNSVAKKLGAEQFSFFEFTVYGLILLAVGIVFMTIASRWLPKSNSDELVETFIDNTFLFTLTVKPESKLVGTALSDAKFYKNPDIRVLKLIRNDIINDNPGPNTTLRANDKLVVLSDVKAYASISKNEFTLTAETELHIPDETETDEEKNNVYSYVELLILPGSEFIDKSFSEIKNLLYNIARPLGIQNRKLFQKGMRLNLPKIIKNTNLQAGDKLLLKAKKEEIQHLYSLDNTIVLRHHEEDYNINPYKRAISLFALVMVVGLAASGVLSILSSTLTGVALLLVTDCINLSKIYKKVNWQIIFLLAGMIPLGIAMNNSQTDIWISKLLLDLLTGQNNIIILGVLFGITMIMSGFISNNATAVIITPIAITLAAGLDLPAKPFILAVMFAANFSFFTPMGYQTNTLIYGTGAYKFKHFLIIGGLLSIILLVVGTLLLSTMLQKA